MNKKLIKQAKEYGKQCSAVYGCSYEAEIIRLVEAAFIHGAEFILENPQDIDKYSKKIIIKK